MIDLIQPVRSGCGLLDEIEATDPGCPGVACWWLGQSGFVLKSYEAIVYIDPYLSEHLTLKYADTEKPHIRMTEAPIQGEAITHADIVISTHKHSDHMDPVTVPSILASSEQAVYVLPRAHREHVLAWGLREERLVLADVDQPLTVHRIEIIPQPAAHEALDFIPGVGYPHMGFIIHMGGVTLYHSGDGIPYPGLAGRLRAQPVDVAFLPINGRNAARHAHGTPGNFTIEETMCIAELADVGIVVPHHYDMFTFNTVDVKKFEVWAREAYPHRQIQICQVGGQQIFKPKA
jgi:L-ascorbate metabolism protein UlaG (beta-lactamase superfamily)